MSTFYQDSLANSRPRCNTESSYRAAPFPHGMRNATASTSAGRSVLETSNGLDARQIVLKQRVTPRKNPRPVRPSLGLQSTQSGSGKLKVGWDLIINASRASFKKSTTIRIRRSLRLSANTVTMITRYSSLKGHSGDWQIHHHTYGRPSVLRQWSTWRRASSFEAAVIWPSIKRFAPTVAAQLAETVREASPTVRTAIQKAATSSGIRSLGLHDQWKKLVLDQLSVVEGQASRAAAFSCPRYRCAR